MGVAMQYRNGTGNVSSGFTPVPGGAPVWVRITRSGDLFVGELSTDGLTWREIGRVTVHMTSDAVTGLAVTSHERGDLASAEFDDVAIEFCTCLER
jgi:regulation of enolase protein 1 (concanavalin A-like superfamily)